MFLLFIPPLLFSQSAIQEMSRDSVVARTWTTDAGQAAYALSLDGGATFGRSRLTDYQIHLRYQGFDPRVALPQIPSGLQASSQNQLWIVQYITQGVEPWRAEIQSLGAEPLRFLPKHANVWRMTPKSAAEVAQLPYVRWVGAFHPAYKLENELLDAWKTDSLETRRYNLVVGAWGSSDKSVVTARLSAMDIPVLKAIDEGWIVEAVLTPSELIQVIQWNEILGVDRKGDPEVDMDNVRSAMGGNYVETVGGFTGNGVRAEAMDSGLDTSHPDWSGTRAPIWHGSSAVGSHGTCIFGIVFGDGSSTSSARGMMPNAQGIMAYYGGWSNRYTHTQECVNSTLRCVFQTNSWGDPRTTQYTSVSQEMDDIIFLTDFSILQSQSNSGWQDSRPQAWAKNMISVGGFYHYDDTSDGNDSWSGGASVGPAADGRIKPDISAYYDATHCSDESGGAGYSSGDTYTSFGGTSGATPIVAGHLGLFYEMWHAGIFGNATGTDVFDSRPHQTTAKAMLLNSTKQYSFSGSNHDMTRVHQGWGRPDLQNMYDRRNQFFIVDETAVLGNMGQTSWNLEVPAGEAEFRATMVYADPAGSPSASVHRVNDLSMRVTSPTGDVYWGNAGLLTGTISVTGGLSNTLDTVEQVIVLNPQAGTWAVDIFADEVNEDAHLETTQVDADFALVVSPVTGSSGGNTVNSIQLQGPTHAWPNNPALLTWSNAPGLSPWYLLTSASSAGSTQYGHEFDLADPITIQLQGTNDATGSQSLYVTPSSALSGMVFFVEVAAVSSGEIYDSNVIQVTIM